MQQLVSNNSFSKLETDIHQRSEGNNGIPFKRWGHSFNRHIHLTISLSALPKCKAENSNHTLDDNGGRAHILCVTYTMFSRQNVIIHCNSRAQVLLPSSFSPVTFTAIRSCPSQRLIIHDTLYTSQFKSRREKNCFGIKFAALSELQTYKTSSIH